MRKTNPKRLTDLLSTSHYKMAGPVLEPRSLNAISVLFLIEKHFTFMFIKILLSVRYATHIKWFLKLFLELPWKKGLFEDILDGAFSSSQLHHCAAISPAAEIGQKGHEKGAQGIHCLQRVTPSSKELELRDLSWGRDTSQFTLFCLTLVHEEVSTIYSAGVESIIYVLGTGALWLDLEEFREKCC